MNITDSSIANASVWNNYAVKVEVTETGGVCVQIYNRDSAGERWSHNHIGAPTLIEVGTHLAIVMDQVERRGFEKGQEHVRTALGFPRGSVRR